MLILGAAGLRKAGSVWVEPRKLLLQRNGPAAGRNLHNIVPISGFVELLGPCPSEQPRATCPVVPPGATLLHEGRSNQTARASRVRGPRPCPVRSSNDRRKFLMGRRGYPQLNSRSTHELGAERNNGSDCCVGLVGPRPRSHPCSVSSSFLRCWRRQGRRLHAPPGPRLRPNRWWSSQQQHPSVRACAGRPSIRQKAGR